MLTTTPEFVSSHTLPSPRLPCKLTTTEWLDQQDEDTVLDTNAEVSCPYCGETVALALDPAGGALQEYVEDCHVCCRAWRVRVHYDAMGRADVLAEPTD